MLDTDPPWYSGVFRQAVSTDTSQFHLTTLQFELSLQGHLPKYFVPGLTKLWTRTRKPKTRPSSCTFFAAKSWLSNHLQFSATDQLPLWCFPSVSNHCHSRRPSSQSLATGFSLSTCFPASSASLMNLGCDKIGKAMMTDLMFVLLRRSEYPRPCAAVSSLYQSILVSRFAVNAEAEARVRL